MYYVYILHNKQYEKFYTGMTNNIERRLYEHNSGQVKPTKAYKPWVVVYQEEYVDRVHAREREKYWKSGVGRQRRVELLLSKK